MRIRIKNLRRVEVLLLVAGAILVGYAAFRYISGRVVSSAAMAKFQAQTDPQPDATAHVPNAPKSLMKVDYSLWSDKRIKEYKAALAERADTPLGVLRVEKIHLEVPVFDGTDDRILDEGVGRIVGTARIGQIGNIGIAGHRDGFFRGLKDVEVGDTMQLDTDMGTQDYVIDSIKLVTPDDVSILRNEPTPALTLVTCYPFYFVGSAPQRYIVHAAAKGEPTTLDKPDKASLQVNVSKTKEKTQ
jgi:sortase A